MEIFNIMIQALKKKFVGLFVKEPTLVKPREFVPFDLIIGASLRINTNNHVIYKSRCSFLSLNTVTDIGKSKLGDSTVFRIYFGDNCFLQVITNDKNQIEECRVFSLVDTIYPSTLIAWSEWLSEDTGKIGNIEFKLDYSSDTYLRMSSWADDEPDWVPPVTFTETIESIRDKFATITHQAMAYGRWLNEDNQVAEYLIVSSDSTPTSENIKIFVGIDINPAEVVTYC